MKVKDKVYKLLSENTDRYISGEEMADKFGVSRSAVWKAVKTLSDDGFNILAVTNKGYKLEKDSDVLTKQGILKYLSDEAKEFVDIEVFETIDSTNTRLKEMAANGEAEEGKVLVALEQTAGKGRMNRKFYSPSKTGVYLSILLKPDTDSKSALYITTMTAVALCNAIESVVNVECKIKWVNDIYINEKKVVGILSEGSQFDYIVVGIGVNVKEPEGGFSEDIKDIAASITTGIEYDNYDLKNRLAAAEINNIVKEYKDFSKHEFMKKYKEKSMLIGKLVYVTSDPDKEELEVIDIDDDAALVVRHKDGSMQHLSSGEVSVKWIKTRQ